MNWRTLAQLRRTLAWLPGGPRLYRLGQRLTGDLRSPPVARKVKQGQALLAAGQRGGFVPAGQHAIEWGTGWAPLLPLLFWLHGQASCLSLDVVPLLRRRLLLSVVRQLLEILPTSEPGIWPERREALAAFARQAGTAAALWNLTGIRCRAPVDTAATGAPAGGADVLYSNAVLEHIPAAELPRILAEAYRLLRPGGVMLHQIDLSDHYAHRDHHLSPIHFLQFSNEAFRQYNSPFLYQNRLRAPAYRQLIEAAGFQILVWETVTDGPSLAALSDLSLAPQFTRYSPVELCTLEIRLMAVVPPDEPQADDDR